MAVRAHAARSLLFSCYYLLLCVDVVIVILIIFIILILSLVRFLLILARFLEADRHMHRYGEPEPDFPERVAAGGRPLAHQRGRARDHSLLGRMSFSLYMYISHPFPFLPLFVSIFLLFFFVISFLARAQDHLCVSPIPSSCPFHIYFSLMLSLSSTLSISCFPSCVFSISSLFSFFFCFPPPHKRMQKHLVNNICIWCACRAIW